MDIQVTLTLPQRLIQQVEQVARTANQPLEEILTEALEEAFPAFPLHPDRERMLAEQAAYAEQLPQLLSRYRERHVAMYEGQVVDHDEDETALLTRVQTDYPDQMVLVRQVLPTLPPPIVVRSPRFVREE